MDYFSKKLIKTIYCVIIINGDMMEILYGGAFNPPTLAHYEIIKYITNKFEVAKLIILPTNNFYKAKDAVSFLHRKKMLELLLYPLNKDIEISDYEITLDKYYGTYYTLKHFNNPYFVIGADQLVYLDKWIKYPDVVIENKFIVFPRDNINIQSVIEKDIILSEYKNNFIIIDDFKEMDISSSKYRDNNKEDIIMKSVLNYIKENKLYEVM